jgi:hypothetical protein
MIHNNHTNHTSVTKATRELVFARDGYECWLCGDVSPTNGTINITHQIHAAASNHPFPLFKANGTIAIPNLSHQDNLFPLCTSCYTGYNLEFPEWIITPDTDTLNKYLEHEEEEYDHRLLVSQTSRTSLPRTLPSIDRTKVFYHPAILSPNLQLQRFDVSKWPKHWLGDPTTVIHRAAWHGLFDSNPIAPIRVGRKSVWKRGVQPVFQDQVAKLVRLWARPVPKF